MSVQSAASQTISTTRLQDIERVACDAESEQQQRPGVLLGIGGFTGYDPFACYCIGGPVESLDLARETAGKCRSRGNESRCSRNRRE